MPYVIGTPVSCSLTTGMAPSSSSSPSAGTQLPGNISSLIFSLKSKFLHSDFVEVGRRVSLEMEKLKREKEEMEVNYQDAMKESDELKAAALAWEDKFKLYEMENKMLKEKLVKLADQNPRLGDEISAVQGSKLKAEARYEKLEMEVDQSVRNKNETIAELFRKNQGLETDKKELEALCKGLETEKEELEGLCQGLLAELQVEKRGLKDKELEVNDLLKRNEVLEMEKIKIEEDLKKAMIQKEDEVVELIKKNQFLEAEKKDLEGDLSVRVVAVEEECKKRALTFLKMKNPEFSGCGSLDSICGQNVGQNAASDADIKDLGQTSLGLERISNQPRSQLLVQDVEDSCGHGTTPVQMEPVIVDISGSDDEITPPAVEHKRKQSSDTMARKVNESDRDSDSDDDRLIFKRRKRELNDITCPPSNGPSLYAKTSGCRDNVVKEDVENPEESRSALKIISSVRRSREENVWEFKEDMVYAFNKDYELCLKAVCALNRSLKTLCAQFLLNGDTQQKRKSLSRIGELSEILIDGDPEGKLKKSASDLRQQDLQDCRSLSLCYNVELFYIYMRGSDPFFRRGAV